MNTAKEHGRAIYASWGLNRDRDMVWWEVIRTDINGTALVSDGDASETLTLAAMQRQAEMHADIWSAFEPIPVIYASRI